MRRRDWYLKEGKKGAVSCEDSQEAVTGTEMRSSVDRDEKFRGPRGWDELERHQDRWLNRASWLCARKQERVKILDDFRVSVKGGRWWLSFQQEAEEDICERAGVSKSSYSHVEFKELVEHSVDIEEMAGNEGPDLSREAWMVVRIGIHQWTVVGWNPQAQWECLDRNGA